MIRDGQNIYDYCLQTYGTLENIFDLLNDNSLGLNSDLQSGQELNANTFEKGNAVIKKLYDDKEIIPVNSLSSDESFNFISLFIKKNESEPDESVQENQNIFDICLQYFGNIDQIFSVTEPNNLAMNTYLNGGQLLNINSTDKGDEDIKDYYKRLNIKPNNNTVYPEESQLDLLLQWPEFLDKDIIIQKQLIIL